MTSFLCQSKIAVPILQHIFRISYVNPMLSGNRMTRNELMRTKVIVSIEIRIIPNEGRVVQNLFDASPICLDVVMHCKYISSLLECRIS